MNASPDSFFGFNRRELNGIFVLSILIAAVIAAPDVYDYFHPETFPDYAETDAKMAAWLGHTILPGENSRTEKYPVKTARPAAVMFPFDPNNLPGEKWAKLGLSERQIRVLKNYEAKGGRFRSKEDVHKIYSITEADFKRLEPYIRIAETAPPGPAERKAELFSPPKIARAVSVELNAADSATLTSVRGIGPAFARRIIRYRERLGGFHHKEQLLEVFGIDSVHYAVIEGQVLVEPARLQTIAINTAGFDELKQCPYLNFKQANAIIQFRRQHGPFQRIEDLGQIVILNSEILRKIEPYIRFQ